MKKCPKCNAEFAWGIEVCPSCGKKIKNQKVDLHLKNASGQECTISCSEKVKMSLLQMYVELRFGVPAMNIKPIVWKDIAITFGLFFSIFLFPVILENAFGILIGIAVLVVNLIYTKNFYYNAIKKKLSEGYIPSDEDTATILNNVGLGNVIQNADGTSTNTTNVDATTTNSSDNSFSDKVSAFAENTKTTIKNGGFKKFLTKKNIIIAVAAIAVVLIIMSVTNTGDNNNVAIVKNGYFFFNQVDTVGELVNSSFKNVKWEAITGTDGKSYVNMTATDGSDKLLIQFRINEKNETFIINACEVNGIPLSIDELF